MHDVPSFVVFLAMIGGVVVFMFAVAVLIDLGVCIRRKFKQR